MKYSIWGAVVAVLAGVSGCSAADTGGGAGAATTVAYQHLEGDPNTVMTVCGRREIPRPGSTPLVDIEQYDLDLLQREARSNPAVAARAGVNEVRTCADARAYMAEYQRTVEADLPVTEVPATSQVGSVQEALKGGTLISSARGMVSLDDGGCSGFLFAGQVIITAAHCLPGRSGTDVWNIDYFDPDTGGQRRIASHSNKLRYLQHPNWKGGTDAHYDVGIIVSSSTWSNTTSKDYLPVLWGDARVVDTLTIFGSGWENFAGTNTGRLRVGEFGVSSVEDSLYIVTRSSGDRICKGDSGGAGTFNMQGGRTAVTVNSNGEFESKSDLCVCKGCKARHAIVTPLIVNWIRDQVTMDCIWTPDLALQQSYVNCE